MEARPGDKINIRPGVSILSVLKHLNYKPWYAIAEFIDNSIQSYLVHKDELENCEGHGFRLEVTVAIDEVNRDRIAIRDNAAGIHEKDYPRAFRPAQLPQDRSGLAEFGMGMKSAACWFAPIWEVRTSALGEGIERTVSFDIAQIVRDDLNELKVDTRSVPERTHFTEIVLHSLHKPLHGNTIRKIEEHLASIFRQFIRDGILTLKFGKAALKYESPAILVAPYHKVQEGPKLEWRKDIAFDFGQGLRAHGFAALREVASTSYAGFALFRRGRLIEGSGDETYRPEQIFGKPNSYRYQRLFGELHLDGFEVSHTKDGFKWDENEEAFLSLLKEDLDEEPLPLLDQAEEFRAKTNRQSAKRLEAEAEKASARTASVLEDEAPSLIDGQRATPADESPPQPQFIETPSAAKKEFEIELKDEIWRMKIDLSVDPSIGDWVDISDQPAIIARIGGKPVREMGIRLSLAHPFMERFSGADSSQIEPLLRVAVALCLAEVCARESGVKGAGTIRRNINEYLFKALSKP